VTKRKAINVRLFGGLGNQFFQYFAGLELSNNSHLPLFLDFRWIESGYSHQGSDLRDFRFAKNFASHDKNTSSSLNFRTEKLKTKLASNSKLMGELFSINSPVNPGFVELKPRESGLELRGYYQSYKYYEKNFNSQPMEDFSLLHESDLFQARKSELTNAPFIAVHVRGGDYLKKQNLYHKLDSDYYIKAIDLLREVCGKFKVYVFSDDTEYAKDLLKEVRDASYVDEVGLRASDSMVLMSLGEGIVIGNSTFSYWSAVLNHGNNIIAPKFWYSNKHVDKYLYPSNWRVI
jgi:hypothetical protein